MDGCWWKLIQCGSGLWKDDFSCWCMIQNWVDWMNSLWKDEQEWWCSLLKCYVWPWRSIHESHGWWGAMSLVGNRTKESRVGFGDLHIWCCGARGFCKRLNWTSSLRNLFPGKLGTKISQTSPFVHMFFSLSSCCIRVFWKKRSHDTTQIWKSWALRSWWRHQYSSHVLA
jgi:hypothetical protein